MADFCKECSINMWGFDGKDLAGLVTKEESEKGIAALVLCETCGIIYVDHEGKRIEEKKDE